MKSITDGIKKSHKNYKYRRLSDADNVFENFLQNNDQESDNRNDLFELQKRGSKLVNGEASSLTSRGLLEYDTLVDRPIQQGESLASISIKYRISVAELKRVNKLQKETEFYALSSIKIPANFNSALFELLQNEVSKETHYVAVHSSFTPRSGSSSFAPRASSGSEVESEIEMPVGLISINQILREKKTRKEARRFFENMQKDLSLYHERTQTYKSTLDEAANTLTSISFTSLKKQDTFRCSGTDWGLSWWKVLTVGGIIIIGVPVFYILIYPFLKSS